MGFFSSTPPKKGLTQNEYVHHRIHAKLRSVFGYGKQEEKKWDALKQALEIEEDKVHHRAHVKHALEEDDMEKTGRLPTRTLKRSGALTLCSR
jgi:peptide subunit release factor 1 (eRF1)